MLIANPRATRTPYPTELKQILSMKMTEQSREWLLPWDKLNASATPLWDLPETAEHLRIKRVSLKDESLRSPLGSFKALGAPIALVRLMLRLLPEHRLDAKSLITGCYRELLTSFTVISATDGNHGKALAAAAQTVGCRCVIVLHANVSIEREQAIAAHGAAIIRIKGNYDESVEEAARLATANGWNVVSDTSYDGYEEIPRDVMQGYSIIASEIVEQSNSRTDEPAFTHVFLQGGVGGFAAGIVSYLWEFHGKYRPRFVVVEPRQADCLYQSALEGRAARTAGSLDSVMAGLACGATSPLAWKFLQPSVEDFLTIGDDDAVKAMRALAAGNKRDVPIIAGESGAASLAGLNVLLQDARLANTSGLGVDSCVLLINTEGATAPSVYRELVGETAESVLERQTAWLNGEHASYI